jgi:hypothetical protein
MRIDFREELPITATHCYSYFRSPRDWTRLYGMFGEVEDRGDGWWAVPLRGFPFPLVARVDVDEPDRRVHWTFGGIWHGEGEVVLEDSPGGVTVSGFEEIGVRWLPRAIERALAAAFLERRFRGIWAHGWRRLRREGRTQEPARARA